jgi:hypothetical protein
MSVSAVADALGRCHYYRTVCQLPCHVDESGRIAVTIGGRVRAVTTPEPLGNAIREYLLARSWIGPIVWHRSRMYTAAGGNWPTTAPTTFIFRPRGVTKPATMPGTRMRKLPRRAARRTDYSSGVHVHEFSLH